MARTNEVVEEEGKSYKVGGKYSHQDILHVSEVVYYAEEIKKCCVYIFM